ncbi:hypothetical protein IWQ62_006434, partial [Dispira parvispora]
MSTLRLTRSSPRLALVMRPTVFTPVHTTAGWVSSNTGENSGQKGNGKVRKAVHTGGDIRLNAGRKAKGVHQVLVEWVG